jgi:hypothetical protein
MTRLSTPENWVLVTMNEMEVAEMIEKYIDFYVEDDDGNRRSVHLPMPFVRHFMNRDDDLPLVVAISAAPLVMPTGRMLAPTGLDRLRGIQFVIPDDLRAIIPKRRDCTEELVRQAMAFLCDNWLVDVATDYNGKCVIIADALTLIERSLLPERPCFFLYRRPARRRQEHNAADVAHCGYRHVPGGIGVVDGRGGAPQGVAGLFHAWEALHPVG